MNLRLGNSGDAVLRLQKDLNTLGEQLKPTGVYDLDTSHAVSRAQKKLGKQIDGVARASLISELSKLAAALKTPARVETSPTDIVRGTGVWGSYSNVNQPGIQVVMTAKNAAPFVGRALSAIELAMSGRDWVLIFVDDGSVDQTYAVAADRETTASHRVFRRCKASKTIGAARNTALFHGKEYWQSHPVVLMVDADDVIAPELVDRLVNPMVAHGHSVAFGDYTVVSPHFPNENGINVVAEAEHQVVGSIPIGTVAFHAGLIPHDGGLFDEELRAHEDGALWVKWFKAGIRMVPMNGGPVCQCYRRLGSVSRPNQIVRRQELEVEWIQKRIQLMESNLARQMVSALMLTGKCPEREPLARMALHCFTSQTWPNKQLVIINHGDYTLANGDPRIKEIKVSREGLTLGDLRNLSIDNADGEWLIQWDDDDWHHPARMEMQMEVARPDVLSTFHWQIRLNLQTGASFYDRMPGGQHMSILFNRRITYRYLPLEIREDTEFKQNFKNVAAIDNSVLNPKCDPLMYVRTYHGHNIWDVNHVLGGSQANHDPQSTRLELLGYHADKIREIMRNYQAIPGFQNAVKTTP